jgi:hypothetical protein
MSELVQQSTDVAVKVYESLVNGDLAPLSTEERINYYRSVCRSVGLNPLTKPFEFMLLNGKVRLYALKSCADQLRAIHGISIDPPIVVETDQWITVTVTGTDRTGRRDSEIGVVSAKDMQSHHGNALMKAMTKAKRRLTLSMCGLGMLDETEVDDIPGYQKQELSPVPETASQPMKDEESRKILKSIGKTGKSPEAVQWRSDWKAALDEVGLDMTETVLAFAATGVVLETAEDIENYFTHRIEAMRTEP